MKNKTYNIITIGCQMNKSDSERMAAVLEKQGFKYTDNKYRADLIVVNTCGVRQSAEDRVYGLIPRIKEENPKAKIVVTGCLVGREEVKRRLKDYVDVWLPIAKISDFRFQISDLISKKSKIENRKSKMDDGGYLNLEPKYSSKIFAFVPVGNGCNNFCSYCVVPYARGREVWRPGKNIIDEVKCLVKNGYKEIILIAQNVNSYHSKFSIFNFQFSNKSKIQNSKQKTINFSDLLKIINDIPNDFKIGFATSHPKDMSDELINTMAQSVKVLPQIHLPVQSGDDRILKKMNRNYTAAYYKKLIKKIRATFRKYRGDAKVEISTDIIAGFPGETKMQFQNTVKLCREVKFDKAYIARYSPRPGTAAARLKDDVAPEEKKRRWMVLEKLINR